MISPGQVFRLIKISWVLIKNGLDEMVFAIHLFRPLRFFKFFLPGYWLRPKNVPRGQRIRAALEDLGPLFVKFGQIVSTRRDLLPDDIAEELAKLQDKVKPFPGRIAIDIVQRELGAPITELFKQFSEAPLASASIAQVHQAQLFNGREVVVKVVRPGIIHTIRRDLRILYTLAELAQRYWPESRRLRPREVVAEYEKTLLDELDLLREAANASQLRRNFENSILLYVPEVEWDYCHRQVMVMEQIKGIPISDIEQLRQANIDLRALAYRGTEIFFTQVFRHSFFHADMHPGNIFVADNGQYIAVDFGIMGSLSPDDQNYLAQNFYAFFRHDYRRVAELHIESGWVPKDTRVNEFEAAIRTVCEPIFQKPLKEISFGHLLLRLFQTARRFNMQVQPQLVLLQKTLLNIEGLGRQLYPDLDLWATAKPFFEQWVHERTGPKALINKFGEQWPRMVQLMPRLPELIEKQLEKSPEHDSQSSPAVPDLQLIRQQIRGGQGRIVTAVLAAALIISSAVIYGLDTHATYNVYGAPLMAWLLATLGAVLMVLALLDDR